MHIVVTGAAGFLGRRLVSALLRGQPALPPVGRITAADTSPLVTDDSRVDVRVGTITDPAFTASLVTRDVDVVMHLAAIVSGQAEAEFDVGMSVNVDGTRALLEACRHRGATPRIVFASTVAVFGGPLPPVVPEDMVVLPQSSYGVEKAIGELLVLEYSRRGFVDGLVCRLPTVAVRPGKPNAAMSSFVSGIVREPLNGVEAVCPVPLDTRLWISSPDTVTANLVQAATMPLQGLAGSRAINFPGLTVTPAEMLDSLERLGGAEVRTRVRAEPDERIARIVRSWPGAFDVSRPLGLGFVADDGIDAIVRQFIAG
jgi:nucleoside-diphosphate-sugar epimerase